MKHLKDRRKVEQGRSCQKEAEIAFNALDFEEAFYLYTEAEKLYREGFEWPGDRVFFMQSFVLRCLRELIDSGRFDFSDVYQVKAEAFFTEWSETEINNRITDDAREAALASWHWIKSYFSGVFKFRIVNAAIELEDFEKARQILDEFISELESNPYPESDALCTIARSKREIMVVKEEFRKPEDQQDISVIAEAYMRAAEASQLPENSTSLQRQRIESYRDWFSSEALKFSAFAFLRDDKMSEPVLSLSDAEQYLATAVSHAQKAISNPNGANFPKSHHSYLRYWHAIVSERLHLLKFMEAGNDEEFKLSVEAWKNALNIAKEFSEQSGEEAIFPNRFYSLQDLELEEFFLEAAYAFRQQKWANCVTHLEKWRQEFPLEYCWSWRDIQVHIRLLFTKALRAFAEGDRQELLDICKELERVKTSEPIGNIGRFLVDEARGLQKGIPLSDEYIDLLCTRFPLDSYTDSYQPGNDIDPFWSLPQRIYNWLDQTRAPSNSVEIEEFKAKFLGCIVALLGYICDYHLQNLLPSELVPPPDLEALIERLSWFMDTYWGERKSLTFSLESLKEAIDQMQKAEELELYRDAYEKVYGALRELIRLVPVIVEIKSATPSTEEPKGIEAIPDWMIHRFRLGREKLFIFTSPEILLESGRYYLPPEWRKGNLISYRVSERQPILPVRYQPQWELWEKEAANASLLLMEGISFKHLERAITLAEKCVSEDEEIHPKVGAIIVKDDKIVSEAYRNEDGKGGHAEEIAIKRCRKEDLKGATIIATLEPCTTGRHHPNFPCAHLITYNEIQKVVIGILDPNPDIRGKAESLFRKNDILVAYFPSKLSRRIWGLNEDFIKKHTKDDFRTVYLYKK